LKNLVYIVTRFTNHTPTAIGNYYEERLWEFIISLKHLAKYEGEILAFDYGSYPHIITKLKDFGVKVISLPNPDYATNPMTWQTSAYFDVIPHLKEYKGYNIGNWDFDVWFQDSIDPMFLELEDIEGCYFITEKGRSVAWRGGPIKGIHPNYEFDWGRREKNLKHIGGFVSGNFMAGKQENYITKLELIKNCFEKGNWDINHLGAEQSIFNLLLDLKKDKWDITKYGGLTYYYCDQVSSQPNNVSGEPVIKDNKICLNDKSKELFGDISLSAIHCNAMLNRGKGDKFRFKVLHKDLWEQYK